MNKKIQNILDQLVDVIAQWPGINTITVMENEHESDEPYFFLSLDVYYKDQIPNANERQKSFPFAGAFEMTARKDRFMIGYLSVRLEYKDIDYIDDIIDNSMTSAATVLDAGSYMFHRIMEAKRVYGQSSWLEQAQKCLQQLENSFWEGLRESAQMRMEHFLGDLSAATAMEDELFFMIAASGFIRSACRALFARNQVFEPSPRQYSQRALGLRHSPADLPGLLESFIRHHDTSFTRKREIAELLARRIISI